MYTPTGAKLGTYWSVYDAKELSMTYYWNIINSGGGSFESGSTYSGLKGEYIAKQTSRSQLHAGKGVCVNF